MNTNAIDTIREARHAVIDDKFSKTLKSIDDDKELFDDIAKEEYELDRLTPPTQESDT